MNHEMKSSIMALTVKKENISVPCIDRNLSIVGFPTILHRSFSRKNLVSFVSSKCLVKREPRKTILSLIENKKFSTLTRILKNDRCNFHSWIPKCYDTLMGQSPLQLLLKNNPSVEIVDLLLMRMKQTNREIFIQDDEGMTALHVAVAEFCDVGILDLLLSVKYASSGKCNAAAILDKHDRYALHYICSNPIRVRNFVSTAKAIRSFEKSLGIIQRLVTAFPPASIAIDKYGRTPLEMATNLSADKEILLILNTNHEKCGNFTTYNDDKLSVTCDSSTESSSPVVEICFPTKADINNDDDDDVSAITWVLGNVGNTRTGALDVGTFIEKNKTHKQPIVSTNMETYRFL